MPYCIYLRKSRADTEAEQRGEGDTLARHETILIELARKMNLDVTMTYKELVSGDNIAARPVMQKMLNEIGKGFWDGVIVMEIERLARGDTIDQGIIAQSFKFTDTKIITPSKTYNPNDEFDEEYFEFGLFMSRREYKTIRRRMERGREAAVKEGKYIGTYPPYGYNKVWRGKDSTLEINPEQAEIVKLIYELYTAGERNDKNSFTRLGYNSIALKLNNMNIPSMRDTKWIASTVKVILKNPVYIGKVRWHYKKEVKRIIDGELKAVTTTNKDGEYILANGLHEPIIDVDTWEKAQCYVKQIPPAPAPVMLGVKNPFAGLIICGKCGKKMQRKPCVNKPDSLICTTHNCANKSVYFHKVEREILFSLQRWLAEYKLKSEVEKDSDDIGVQLSMQKSRLTNMLKENDILKAQLEKAYNLLEQGVYDVSVFRERSDKLKSGINELADKINLLQKEIENSKNYQVNNSVIIPKTKSLLQAYDTIKDNGEKNKLLKQVLTKVVYVREKGKDRDSIDNKFEVRIFPKISQKLYSTLS